MAGHDPTIDQVADLQRSIMATLTYIMGLASVAELYGLQGTLSQLASRMTDVGLPPDEQIREIGRQAAMQGLGPSYTSAQYRQEG